MKWFKWLTGRRESHAEARQRRYKERERVAFNEALHRFWADEIIGEPEWEWFLRTEHAIVHTPYGFRDISDNVLGEVRQVPLVKGGVDVSPSADVSRTWRAHRRSESGAVDEDLQRDMDAQAQASLGPMRSWSCPHCAGWMPLR